MTRKPIRLLILLVLALSGFGAAAQVADDVIATLGGAELRASELRRLVAAQPAGVRERLLAPEALDRLVRTEMFRRVLAAEARAKGWDKRPEAIEQMERAREQALVSAYVDGLARPAVDYPGEAELRAAYEANRSEFTRPRAFRLAQIFSAERGKAEEAAKRARAAGADFAALARSQSEHAESAARGGEMGWLAETQMLPELARAVAALKPGEVSPPVQGSAGWHVLKLLETRAAETQRFEEAREALALALRARRAQENEQRYYDAMLAKTPIAVNEVGLLKLRTQLGSAR